MRATRIAKPLGEFGEIPQLAQEDTKFEQAVMVERQGWTAGSDATLGANPSTPMLSAAMAATPVSLIHSSKSGIVAV